MAAKPPKLKNAPLAEVVFEARWALDDQSGPIPQLRTDPGYSVLASNFTDWAKRQKFAAVEKVGGQQIGSMTTLGWTIDRRYRKSADSPFPLWQIGPGIFAANDTSSYEWRTYKRHALQGLSGVLANYPDLRADKLQPLSMELRYLDIFSAEIIDGRDFVKFANEGTHFGISPSSFLLDRRVFSGLKSGRLLLQFHVKSMKHTTFSVDLVTVRLGNGVEAIRLESKVHTSEQGMPRRSAMKAFAGRWLESAHDITSPFFTSVIRPELMTRFK